MPDDDLFSGDDKGGDDKADDKGGKADGGGTAPAIDMDKLTSSIDTAVREANGDLGQAILSIQEQLKDIQTGQQAAAGTGDGTGVDNADGEPSVEFQKFYKDMPAYVKEKGIEGIKESLGPFLKMQAEQTRDLAVDGHKTSVDSEFGEGAWDEFFKETFSTKMALLPLEFQGSREHTSALMSSVYGELYRDPEKRSALEDRRESEGKRREPPVMLSTSTRRATGSKTTEDEKSFVESLQRAGIEYNMERYVKARETGNTLADWQTRNQKKEAS